MKIYKSVAVEPDGVKMSSIGKDPALFKLSRQVSIMDKETKKKKKVYEKKKKPEVDITPAEELTKMLENFAEDVTDNISPVVSPLQNGHNQQIMQQPTYYDPIPENPVATSFNQEHEVRKELANNLSRNDNSLFVRRFYGENQQLIEEEDFDWIISPEFKNRKDYPILLPKNLSEHEDGDELENSDDENDEDEEEPEVNNKLSKKKRKKISNNKLISNHISTAYKKMNTTMVSAVRKSIKTPNKTIDLIAVVLLILEHFPIDMFTLDRIFSSKLVEPVQYKNMYNVMLNFSIIYHQMPQSFIYFLKAFYEYMQTPRMLTSRNCQKLLCTYINKFGNEEIAKVLQAVKKNFSFISEAYCDGQAVSRRRHAGINIEQDNRKQILINLELQNYQGQYPDFDVYQIHRDYTTDKITV